METFAGLKGAIRHLRCTPDGGRVLAASGPLCPGADFGLDQISDEHPIRAWEKSGESLPLEDPPGVGGVTAIELSRDGRECVSFGLDRTLRLAALGDGLEIGCLDLEGKLGRVLECSAGDSWAILELQDPARIELVRRSPLWTPPVSMSAEASLLSGKAVASPDERLVLLSGNGLELWRTGSLELLATLEESVPDEAGFSVDATWAYSRWGGNVSLYNLKEESRPIEIDLPVDDCKALRLGTGGRSFVTLHEDDVVHRWRLEPSGEEVSEVGTPVHSTHLCEPSGDGRWLVYSGTTRGLRMREFESETELAFGEQFSRPGGMAASPDGRLLMTWHLEESLLILWSLEDREPVFTKRVPKALLQHLRFSADSREFVFEQTPMPDARSGRHEVVFWNLTRALHAYEFDKAATDSEDWKFLVGEIAGLAFDDELGQVRPRQATSSSPPALSLAGTASSPKPFPRSAVASHKESRSVERSAYLAARERSCRALFIGPGGGPSLDFRTWYQATVSGYSRPASTSFTPDEFSQRLMDAQGAGNWRKIDELLDTKSDEERHTTFVSYGMFAAIMQGRVDEEEALYERSLEKMPDAMWKAAHHRVHGQARYLSGFVFDAYDAYEESLRTSPYLDIALFKGLLDGLFLAGECQRASELCESMLEKATKSDEIQLLREGLTQAKVLIMARQGEAPLPAWVCWRSADGDPARPIPGDVLLAIDGLEIECPQAFQLLTGSSSLRPFTGRSMTFERAGSRIEIEGDDRLQASDFLVGIDAVEHCLAVNRVDFKSEAERVGLRPGDLLASLDGKELVTLVDLIHGLAVDEPGSRERTHTLRIRRFEQSPSGALRLRSGEDGHAEWASVELEFEIKGGALGAVVAPYALPIPRR